MSELKEILKHPPIADVRDWNSEEVIAKTIDYDKLEQKIEDLMLSKKEIENVLIDEIYDQKLEGKEGIVDVGKIATKLKKAQDKKIFNKENLTKE